MSNIRIIGIGSPFGNDTLGWQVIRKIRAQGCIGPATIENLDLIEADRPGAQLIQLLQGAKQAILVDAILDPGQTGKIVRVDKDQMALSPSSISSHEFGVSSAIALADKLGLLPESLSLVGLGINPDEETPLDETTLNALILTISNEISQYLTDSIQY